MCLAMNDDKAGAGKYVASTSNRNFQGRQGPGGRTFLASPLTAAASALHRPADRPEDGDLAWNRSRLLRARLSRYPRRTSTPTRSSRRAFSKTTDHAAGLGDNLFCDWRYEASGQPKPDFILNRSEMKGRQVLVAGRQLRLWQLAERHAAVGADRLRIQGGHQHVVQDIFRNNALKNGLLPIVIDSAAHQKLFDLLAADPEATVTVDLQAQTLTLPDGEAVQFPIDDFSRTCLLQGVDELGYLLGHEAKIAAYEAVLERGQLTAMRRNQEARTNHD